MFTQRTEISGGHRQSIMGVLKQGDYRVGDERKNRHIGTGETCKYLRNGNNVAELCEANLHSTVCVSFFYCDFMYLFVTKLLKQVQYRIRIKCYKNKRFGFYLKKISFLGTKEWMINMYFLLVN